jgi:hypothetical protein
MTIFVDVEATNSKQNSANIGAKTKNSPVGTIIIIAIKLPIDIWLYLYKLLMFFIA